MLAALVTESCFRYSLSEEGACMWSIVAHCVLPLAVENRTTSGWWSPDICTKSMKENLFSYFSVLFVLLQLVNLTIHRIILTDYSNDIYVEELQESSENEVAIGRLMNYSTLTDLIWQKTLNK